MTIEYIIYPTGRTYHRTSYARSVDSVTTTFGANTATIMGNLSYRPFGGATGMNNGAGGIVGSQYDLSGRLLVSNPGAEHEMTYGYDNNGNLTSINAPSTPWYNRVSETPTTYTYYPGTNRLYQTITATETKNYFYDANSNTTGIGNRTFAYNQDNRLIKVEENSATLGEYTYNGIGQRIIKIAGGVTTVFHYDFDDNIIGESDASGVFSQEYLYRGSNRLVLVDVGTGVLYYYGNDQLGTPHILTDSTNTVVWEAVYAPYGEADVNPNSIVVNNFRFSGQYYDAETGLHYNYHRYYEPGTGRYLTADPIGLDGGINLFAYSSNNPVNWIDPFGLSGSLTIYSSGNGGGSSGSGGLSGHSWISYTPDAGSTTTYGTWGNNPYGLGNGLFQNLEIGRKADASRSIHINDKQEALLYQVIGRYINQGENAWSYSSPCSSFASDAWNSTTGEKLNPYGPYSNPSSLKNAIIKVNGGTNSTKGGYK